MPKYIKGYSLGKRTTRLSITRNYASSAMHAPYPRYQYLYEDIQKYDDGTLFPVYPGDKLDSDRYTIWDKLGTGSDSHIWLAKDQQQCGYVALKLLPIRTAESQSRTEVTILQSIQKHAFEYSRSHSGNGGSEHIRRFLRRFIERRGLREYNGIVMEVTGQSIQSKLLIDDLGFAKAKEVTKGTIRGLRFLHEQCRVAHGDLYFGNICFAAPNLADMSDDQVRRVLGPVEKLAEYKLQGGEKPSHRPAYTICDAVFGSDGPVQIIDFGQAWRFGNQPEQIQIHSAYRPPELIGNSGRLRNDVGLDLWMLGCTVYQIFTGRSLFDAKVDDLLRDQIDRLLNNPQTTPREALYEELSEDAPDIPEQDRRSLGRILEGLIVEDPHKRHSASRVEQDPWLQC